MHKTNLFILSLEEDEDLKKKLDKYLGLFKKINKKSINKLVIVSYQVIEKKKFAFYIRKLRLDSSKFKTYFDKIYFFEFFNKNINNIKKFNFASDISYLNNASSLIFLDNVKDNFISISNCLNKYNYSIMASKKNFSCIDIVCIKSQRLNMIYDFHMNSSKKINDLLLGINYKIRKINKNYIFFSQFPFFETIKKDDFANKRDSVYFVGNTIYDNYPHYLRNNLMSLSQKILSYILFFTKSRINKNKFIDLSIDTFLKGSSLFIVKLSLVIPLFTFQLLKIYKYIVARIIYDKIANKFLFLGIKMPKFILKIYNLDQIVIKSMTRIRRRQYLYLYLKNITNEKS